MFEATYMEFPFVAALPKREKSKLARVWDTFKEIQDITAEKGSLVPATFAAKLLDISPQRVSELLNQGTLERVKVGNCLFATERSIVELAKSERKAGRPFKLPETRRDCFRRSMAEAKEVVSNAKQARK